MEFRCMFCGAEIEAPDDAIAQEEKCPNCETSIRIPALPQKKWEHQKPTAKQLDHIKSFGVEPFQGITKGEASNLIDRLHEFHNTNESAIPNYIHNLFDLPQPVWEGIQEELKKYALQTVDQKVAQKIVEEVVPDELHPITQQEYDLSDLGEVEEYIEEYMQYKYDITITDEGRTHIGLMVAKNGKLAALRELNDRLCEAIDEADEKGGYTKVEKAKEKWYKKAHKCHALIDQIVYQHMNA